MASPIIEINLDRLVQNALLIKERAKDSEVLAVVKADAYGHGASTVTKVLEGAGIRYFGVFSIDEALELRKNGIKAKILIFERLTKRAIQLAIEHSIIVNISWFGDLDLLKNAKKNKIKLPQFHLKLDTGMSRLGIPYMEAVSFVKELKAHTGIQPEGIYSHLSTSDEGDRSFAYKQKDRFDHVLKELKSILSPKWIHISNSGGLVNMPDSLYNMVRIGMLFYGAKPSSEIIHPIPVEPVMNFKGEIVLVRKVLSGTPISYGALYRPSIDSYIAVVQVGFADGIPRSWYKNGFIVSKGKRYKIAGRICMDQFMVDFGKIKPREGDRVLIWGKDDKNELPIEMISKDIGLSPYVIFTGLGGKRIKREFLNEK
ncbi:MAG: alanine racemase [Candidatus Marinimicrobia bacterium]|nr:alanine racemase [Candidatus Neomarinimicrobiota bacterium]|tara:strand:+ start:619 stop:1731 length:1113 start_codon:yes stop_codon:yes gene_type:complete